MKSIRKLLLIACILLLQVGQAQLNFHLGWEKTIGGVKNNGQGYTSAESYNSMVIYDSSIYVSSTLLMDTSMNLAFKGGRNVYMSKFDIIGTTQWERIIGSTSTEMFPMIFENTPSSLELTFMSFGGGEDVLCAFPDTLAPSLEINLGAHAFTIDSSGAILRKKCFGTNFYRTNITQCIPTSDNGYLICGNCSYLGDSAQRYEILIKCDSLMNEVWHFCLDSVLAQDIKLFEVENGNYFLYTGTSANNTFFGGPSHIQDYALAKFSSAGNLLWGRGYGSAGGERLKNLIQVGNEYVLIGFTDSGPGLDSGDVVGYTGEFDIWVIRIDSVGTLLDQNCIGSMDRDVGMDIIQNKNGGFYIGGFSTSTIIEGDSIGNRGQEDCLIIELDSNLNYIKGKTFGGSGRDFLFNIEEDVNGSLWGWGATSSSDGDVSISYGGMDLWLIRLDPDTILGVTAKPILLASDITIYPNPTKDALSITFKNNSLPLELELLEMHGQLLLRTNEVQQKQSLSLSSFANGVYMLRCSYANGQVLYKKVVLLR